MSVLTRFKELGTSVGLVLDMPYSVRIGDKIELFDDGVIWEISEVTWVVDRTVVNDFGEVLVSMNVVIK
jgi:hypothetical protein